MPKTKQQARQRIRWRIRKKISGTPARPRLAVYRSNKEIYAQIIDDRAGHTLAAASSKDLENQPGATKSDLAKLVGKRLAELATAKNIQSVVFDRGGYLYHGRVKALADGAREGGLQF